MVAAIVATVGDVDVCQCYFDRDVYQFTVIGGFFPVLGFVGDRVGRLCGGEKRGKNHAGIRTKATLIDFILNFTFYILNFLLWMYFQILIHDFQL